MKKIIPYLVLLLCSCQKEPIVDSNIHFEGFWKYQRDTVSWLTIKIEANSKGDIFYVGDGWPGTFGTLTKTWYAKGDQLLFGKNASDDEIFQIDTPPTIATNEIETTFDTIIIGQKYMYLDGNLYIDQP